MYALKPWFLRRLRLIEERLVARRVRADALTVASVVVSIAAGLAIALGGILEQPVWWLAVPPLVVARLACNALDGSLARRQGPPRAFGAVANELGDRASDVATIGGTAFVADPALAMGALSASVLASSTGVLALAVGGARDNAGPMGKADRAVVLAAAAVVGAAMRSAVPFTVALAVIAAGSVVTMFARARRLRRRLRADAAPAPSADVIEFDADVRPQEVIDVIAG